MSNNDKKKMAKNYDYKKALNRKSEHSLLKKIGMTVVAANIMMAPLGQYIEHFGGHTNVENVAYAQTLADVSLLTNVGITSSVDVEQPAEGTPYNVGLSLSGSSLADVELIDTNRVVAFSIPELAGQMTATGPANVSVDLTLVNLDDLPILGNVVGGLTGTLTTTVNSVLSLVSDLESSLIPDRLITIEGIDGLQGSLDALNNIEQALADALQYNGTAPVTVNADGTVTVDMTDGLGNNLDTAVNGVVIQVLNDLITSLNGVSISILPEAESIPGLGLIVRGLNATINTTLSDLTGLAGTVTDTLSALDVPGLTSELARVQLLGSTNVDLNLAVNNPVQFEPGADNIVPVFGSVVNTAIIDANLIGNGTGQSELVFPQQVEEDETAPVLDTPTITGNSTDGYTVSGTGEEPGDTVTLTGEDGAELGTTTIAEDGTYSFDLAPGTVVPEEVLSLVGSDEAGNIGETVTVTVPEDPEAPDETAPVLDTPTITGNSTDGYTVSGTGEEPGDTVTLTGEDGTELGTTTIAEDGTYSFDLAPGTVVPEEVLSLVGSDEAGNIGETVTVTVPEDPKLQMKQLQC